MLALVPDPRRRRGRRYQLTFVLADSIDDVLKAAFDGAVTQRKRRAAKPARKSPTPA